jgi:alpha-N-arabinofuranosidase
MIDSNRLLKAVTALMLTSVFAGAQTAQLRVDTTKVLHPVSPMLYGLMTEEINHSYDGGLYAELLSNHTFRSSWEGVEG